MRIGAAVVCVWLLLPFAVPARAAEDPAPPAFQGKTAAEWIAVLETGDLRGRQQAVWGLFNLAPGCADAAVPLARAVADADEYVRTTAASALVKLGPAAEPAMAVLGGLLANEREEVQREAVSAVYRLGALAGRIVEPLVAALDSPDALIRANAAASRADAGTAAKAAADALSERVEDPDPDVAKWAAIGRAAVDPATAFDHPVKAVRLAAVVLYQNPGSAWDAATLRLLIGRLEDMDSEIRSVAANAIGNAALSMTPYPPEVVAESASALTACLAEDPAPVVRQWAAYALGYLGRAAGGDAAKKASVALLAGTKDEDEEVRRECLRDLGWLGKDAGPEAIDRLIEALIDDDAGARAAAASSLGAIGDPRPVVIEELAAALRDEDDDVRRAAAIAFGAFGPAAEPAVPDLVECLNGAHRLSLRIAVANSLGSIGPAAKGAIPAIEAAGEESPRPEFDHALAKIDPAPARILRLGRWRTDEDEVTAAVALARLADFGPAALPLLPDLVKALEHPYQDARANALRVLAAIGPAAKSAIPAVRARLDDPNPNVREAARVALDALGAE